LGLILLLAFFIFILTLFYLIFYLRLKVHKNKKKVKFILFNNRLSQVNSFEGLSENILFDILEALKDLNGSYEQVHAILPLLSDIRKYGDRLMAQRKFYHTIFFPDNEQRLTTKISRLYKVENFIKSLSRHQRESQKPNLASVLRKEGLTS